MGEACSCETKDDDNALEINLGLDYEGCTEEYHYHKNHVRQLGLDLSVYDRFYRTTMDPLYLMDVERFINKIDLVTETVYERQRQEKIDQEGLAKQVADFLTYQNPKDTESVELDLFVEEMCKSMTYGHLFKTHDN